MNYTKKKEYKGSLKNLKTGKVFDDCFISIIYKKEKPKKVEIILNHRIMHPGKIIEGDVEINTGKDCIYIWKKGYHANTKFFHTKFEINPKEILKITEESDLTNLIKDKINVYVQLTMISFFEHELGWFEHDAFNNLKRISEISGKNTYYIPNFLNECKFYPWITKVDSNKKNTNLFETSMFVEFNLNSEKIGLGLFREIKDKVTLLLRVINFLNDGVADYKKINFNFINNIEEKYENISLKNTKNKSGFNSYGISTKEYLQVINHILGEIMNYSEQELNKFFVLTWRHIKFKKESDISIKIGLIHATLVQLIKCFYLERIQLSDSKKIGIILEKLKIYYNDEIVDNIITFNRSRNDIFKNIKIDFIYDKKFNESVKNALNLIRELLLKYFRIEEDNLKNLFIKLYNYIYISYIKFDFSHSSNK